MNSTRVQRRMAPPGRSVAAERLLFLILNAIPPACLIAILPLEASSQGQGQLPWPVLQWALTSPVGTLATAVIGAVIVVLPFLLGQRRRWIGGTLVDATDFVAVGAEAWVREPIAQPSATPRQRWLGIGARAQRLSVLLLTLTALLTAVLLGISGEAFAYTISMLGIDHCARGVCAPRYPVSSIVLVSMLMALCFWSCAQYWQLRHTEAVCGIWLRVPLGTPGGRPSYFCIRRPGVSAEHANAALERFRYRSARPRARYLAGVLAAFAPLFLLLSVGMFLTAWLPTQWVP